MATAARGASDTNLLPLHTADYLQYTRVKKEVSGKLANAPITDSKMPAFPAVAAIPCSDGIGVNSYHSNP